MSKEAESDSFVAFKCGLGDSVEPVALARFATGSDDTSVVRRADQASWGKPDSEEEVSGVVELPEDVWSQVAVDTMAISPSDKGGGGVEVTVEKLELETGPGATLMAPQGVEGGDDGLPCIVMVHGLAADREQGGIYTRAAPALAGAGIATLRLDMRFGEPEEYGSTTYASQAADVTAAIDAACEHAAVDESRVSLLGMAQGGAVCAMVAASDPRVTRLMLWNPVTNPVAALLPAIEGGWEALAAAARAGGELRAATGGRLWRLGTGFVQDLFRVCPPADLARFSGPVLALVASGDALAPQPASVQGLVRQHGGRTTVVCVPGSDHHFGALGAREGDGRFAVTDRAVAWVIHWMQSLGDDTV